MREAPSTSGKLMRIASLTGKEFVRSGWLLKGDVLLYSYVVNQRDGLQYLFCRINAN